MFDQNLLVEDSSTSNGIHSTEQEPELMEEGFIGLLEDSPEALGVELIEGYDYSQLIEIEEEEDEQMEIASEEEIQEEIEEDLENAWFASYNKERGLEIVIGRDDRVQVKNTKAFPFRAICSLRMTSKTGKRYIGTGWLIGPRTVITAGHCVYFHKEGGWPKSIEVIPGRNGKSKPYGSCVATNFRSVTGWTKSKKRDYDYGAIILPKSCRLGNRVGYFGFKNLSSLSLRFQTLNLSGYPGDKDRGTTQWFHSRRAVSIQSKTIAYQIDTAGGQSGSPVWILHQGKRYGVGIHTSGGSNNSGTRINKDVFKMLKKWKADGS